MGHRTGLVVLACLLATLAGCGGTPEPAPEPQVGAPDAFPVTIEHRFGTATIPAAPQRIVTVGLTDQDAVIALGTIPVGVSKFGEGFPGGIRPWARDEVGDAPLPELLDPADGIPFEAIAALQPDLITALYAGLEPGEYETLNRIAPTVAAPTGVTDFSIGWQQQTEIIGRAMGRSAEATELIAGAEELFTRARAAHPEFAGRTALRGQYTGDTYYASSSRDTFGYLLEQFGFDTPPEIDELAGDDFFAELSPERLDLYEADVLLMQARGPLAGDLQADPLFTGLDVARRGAVVYDVLPSTGQQAAFSYQILSVLSLPYVVENLTPRLAAAADDDPATPIPDGAPVLPADWTTSPTPLPPPAG